ncbi:Flp pilus assembly complex ATPase component TadA [Candidatus Sumerlaeota bacterium]|nr:Flp pilus assembly complex ATPase component TadA [Candidatus Sumerlaeota bacterium]
MGAKLFILTQDRQFEKIVDLDEGMVLSFGRSDDANVVLPRGSVSRLHAQISVTDGVYKVQDLGSTNGVIVNGKRVREQALKPNDKLMMGEFMMLFQMQGEGDGEDAGSTMVEDEPPLPNVAQTMAAGGKKGPAAKSTAPSGMPPRPKEITNLDLKQMKSGGKASTAEDLFSDEYVNIRRTIHDILLDRMDLHQVNILDLQDAELREKTSRAIEQIILDIAGEIPDKFDKQRLHKDVLDEALGLGQLEDLLADPSVTEVMVNHKDQVYVERKGKLTLTDKRFINEAQVRSVIDRIVAPLGRRIDESSPLVDARLKDGSRVNAVIPPLALKGSSITIRKFSEKPLTVADLVKFGSFTDQMASFFQLAVEHHQNIVISGGTGSGKTTLLNVLSSFIGEDERIVTVEDAAELQLRQPHVVSLETRPPNIEGKGAVTIRDLVKNCLRMRPDRIVVGECRGGEALDMLQAMNTGHDGSLTTGHANSPRDMLSRLETMVLMSGMELPVKAIREQMASAINLIIQQTRLPDGSRRVIEVSEVTGTEGEIITMQSIFEYQQTGFDENGRISGYYMPTGIIPKFIEEMRQKGEEVPMDMFQGAAY